MTKLDLSPSVSKVVRAFFVDNHATVFDAQAVSESTGVDVQLVRSYLCRESQRGMLVRYGRGKYKLAETKPKRDEEPTERYRLLEIRKALLLTELEDTKRQLREAVAEAIAAAESEE